MSPWEIGKVTRVQEDTLHFRSVMWRARLNSAVAEVRFILKQGKEHHGAWHFVNRSLPELKMLNPNTFFHVAEINDNFKTDSACHIVYGDKLNTEEKVLTENLSHTDFEEILKASVTKGETLPRMVAKSNKDRALPIDIVEARNTVKYMDDGF